MTRTVRPHIAGYGFQRTRLVMLIALGVFLVWEIVTRGIAAYLAESSPETTLYLRATESTALLNLAEEKLRALASKKVETVTPPNATDSVPKGEPTPSQETAPQNLVPIIDPEAQARTRSEVHSLAERALVNDPLNARAFRILGQLALLRSDGKQAETFMQAATQRSLHESEAVYRMMVNSYQAKDYNAAVRYADTLFRTRQRVSSYVNPVLGKMAENRTSELVKFLVTNPSWREDFFSGLPGNISDARTPLQIFLSLKNTTAPPTTIEIRNYLNFLVDRKFYDLAYYTWLQFLPAEQLNKVGNLFNGNFEFDPSGQPFDWTWTQKPGVTIEIAGTPGEKERAVRLKFGPGRVDFSGLTQLLMLPPGNYQFQGRYKANIVSPRGLHWRITCVGVQGAPIGESAVFNGHDSSWQDFELSFNVPNSDCSAQYVTLASGARSVSEQFISGTIWCDELKIVNESVVVPSKESL